jgi:hypothetical protein
MKRRPAIAAAVAACALAGCGGEGDYANRPRPATPINVTAAISDKKLSVSPRSFGAGPIVITVSNQTDRPQTVTIETDEIAGSKPGIRESTEPIAPRGTSSLTVDVREGTYAISVRSGSIAPAEVEVSKARKSAQDELLLP